ncbi:hypothetical protein N9865_02285 [Paraglaciecola sp.]|nr:hypothetical protein [Paraglaciecola sp.]
MDNLKKTYKGFFSLSTPATGRKVSEFLHNKIKENVTYIGRYKLNFDAEQVYTKKSSAKYSVSILGLVLNPFDGLVDTQEIVDKLYTNIEHSMDAFFDYIDELSGSFVLFYRINNNVFVLQDACATKLCYSFEDSEDSQVCVTSHITLLANIFNLSKNFLASELMRHEDYKNEASKYLPGLLTPYEDVKPLIANNYFDMQKCILVRFYPRQELESREIDAELVERIAGIFKRQAKMLATLGPIAIATTGGKDSRVTLASFDTITERSFGFTFWNTKTNQFLGDLNISSQLLELKGFQHRIFDISKYGSNVQTIMPDRSPMGIWPGAADLYECNFDSDCIHVRSTISEVGRCFYNHTRGSSEISPRRLAQSFTATKFSKSPVLEEIFSEYIDYTNFYSERIFNYDPLDLYYWEHRNSKWQAVLCHEAELAGRVFIPFNNRKILELFLEVPTLARQKASLHKELISYMYADFDNVKLDSNA